MFIEEYEKLSRGEQNQFKEVVNTLLFRCFLVRKSFDKVSNMSKISSSYLFVERHFNLINDYLSFAGMEISKDDDNGVIFLTSEDETNRLRLDSVTTLLVYALRSFYEDRIAKKPTSLEVYIDSTSFKLLLKELGLTTVNKRLSSVSIASSLRNLAMYNIVCRAKNTFSDPSYSFYILPSIRYVISNAKLNALYDQINRMGGEEEEDDFLGGND